MTTEKMNVHKALCELKILDSRISKEIRDFEPCGVTKTVAQRVGTQTVAEFNEAAKSKYDSICDLIARRSAIKRAVVASNATTKVSICGNEYTVAEAIEMKNHGLDHKRMLKTRFESRFADASFNVVTGNQNLDRNADVYITSVAGGDKKVAPEEIQKMRNNYIEPLTLQLVDPLKAQNVITSLSDEIDKFEAEVDSALSVSNAVTEITVSY